MKELGTNISSYKLPVVDTCEERRNFPGYEKNQYFSMDEIIQGDSDGTTETDSSSYSKGSGGYTRINEKKGKSIK